MINSFNITAQTVAANNLLQFNGNNILTGCSTTQSGATTFKLNKSGFYLVTFNASAATSGTAGDVVVRLNNNGVAVPGATAIFNSSAATAIGNLSFITIIQVRPSCCAVNNQGNLTIENAGVEAVYSLVNMTITKIG